MKKQIELDESEQAIFNELILELKKRGYNPDSYSSTFKLTIKLLGEADLLKK
jgi:chorismate mutase